MPVYSFKHCEMINCKYLNLNETVAFQTIVSEKYNPGRAILLSIIHRVIPAYNLYLNKFLSIQAKPSSEFLAAETDERNALQSCFLSPTQSFERIKSRIYNDQPIELKAYCPYCLLDRP